MEAKFGIGYHSLGPHYGFYMDRITPEVRNEIKQQVDSIQDNWRGVRPMNDELAGQIEHEYEIPMLPQTRTFIQELVNKTENESCYMREAYPSPDVTVLDFSSMWVNFQRKYEYNPIHNHRGIYSFVIWYQIPYYNEDEQKYHYSKGSCNHGQFAFVLPNLFSGRSVIQTAQLGIDKNAEGCVAIFPSTLDHIVYPFYSSNEYRITIAGNILDKETMDLGRY